MEWIGYIKSASERALERSAWEKLIVEHFHLAQTPPKRGINPFTNEETLFRADRSSAQIVVNGKQIGEAAWEEDPEYPEPMIGFTSDRGHREKVLEIAIDLGARMNGSFVLQTTD